MNQFVRMLLTKTIIHKINHSEIKEYTKKENLNYKKRTNNNNNTNHFKTITSIYKKQCQIRVLRSINHAIHIIRALHKLQAPALTWKIRQIT